MNRVNCIDPFLKKAEADEPVYITDVRETFDREGSKAFHVHAHLYEGETAVFALGLPQWENDKQREFVAEYVRAFFYNLLSTLGALRIEIYLDRSDEALTALAEGLSDDFQVSWAKTERTGYGKCLNVNERIIRALNLTWDEAQKIFFTDVVT
jgi:hypothetical protein